MCPEKSPAIVNIMRMVSTTLMYPGSQGEWIGMLMGEQRQLHYPSQWGWWMHLSEHVDCVAVAFKMMSE